MAVQTEVKLVCDKCSAGGQAQRAVKTRRFGVDGQQYELEVCEKHDEQMTRDIDTWKGVSRKAGTKPKEVGRARKPGTSRKGADYDPEAVRAWARDQGINVNPEPGARLNPRVVRQYLDAHPAA